MASKRVSEAVMQKTPFFNPRHYGSFRRSFSISSYFDWEPKEVETHTGQKWSSDDYRLVRFMDKKKTVNPNWAIKLIADVPPIPVKERVTYCDGGSGPTGHPRVFINLDKPGNHSCLYCGLRFYREQNHCKQ